MWVTNTPSPSQGEGRGEGCGQGTKFRSLHNQCGWRTWVRFGTAEWGDGFAGLQLSVRRGWQQIPPSNLMTRRVRLIKLNSLAFFFFFPVLGWFVSLAFLTLLVLLFFFVFRLGTKSLLDQLVCESFAVDWVNAMGFDPGLNFGPSKQQLSTHPVRGEWVRGAAKPIANRSPRR